MSERNDTLSLEIQGGRPSKYNYIVIRVIESERERNKVIEREKETK